MKIALAQINTAMGDLEGNEKKIRRYLSQAIDQNCELVIFPELALVGYPPKDHIFEHGFQERVDQIVQALAKDHPSISFILGSTGKVLNVAYVISGGAVKTVCKKNLLPNYDVFDERRYFKPGSELEIVEIGGKKIGITICEDIWAEQIPIYNNDPVKQIKGKSLDFVVNISASPFENNKYERRFKTVAVNASFLSVPMIYVNLVGGNDELIFDGGSFVVNAKGQLLQQAPFFEENLFCFEFSEAIEAKPYVESSEERTLRALTLGLGDFIRKCGFKDVALGLSGGIDSALVLLLAVEALGKEHVFPVFMPSKYTSQDSKEDVAHMIQTLNMPISLIPITDIYDSFEKSLQTSLEENLKELTLENIQSRIRGSLLMAFSSQRNAMVINTGNKSEIATGYCTLYGDTIGGVSPLGDLYKQEVYALAKLLNQKYKAIPERVFTRAPSAELKENQRDSDRLPEYDILDAVVKNHVELIENAEELVARGLPRNAVESALMMMRQSEFKRKQMPPILRVTEKAFGIGRRMPIARKNYEL